ncbi:MAG: DUF2214 family protein [Pseudomonadales bacterium]|nr:DUF2214 family protein [Pseudomonadales bacterium]
MTEILARASHFIGILILFSVVFGQHIILTKKMTAPQIKKFLLLDVVFRLSALWIIAIGIILWFNVGNVPEFYSQNTVFHIKLWLFGFVGIISIIPTLFFLKNRKSNEKNIPVPGHIVWMVRGELILLLCMPVLAAAMARGFNLS